MLQERLRALRASLGTGQQPASMPGSRTDVSGAAVKAPGRAALLPQSLAAAQGLLQLLEHHLAAAARAQQNADALMDTTASDDASAQSARTGCWRSDQQQPAWPTSWRLPAVRCRR